jgi:hypothetical protein
MTLYHPRALADKIEELIPELQRWSHRARMALDHAQIQEKRIEDSHSQSCHSVQTHEHQLFLDQECVQQAEALLQGYAINCQEALAEAQQTASTTQSTLNETQTTYNRMQQALRSAQEALVQAERALAQATALVESKTAEFAKANAREAQDEKRAANHSLSAAQKALDRATSAAHAASARVAKHTKAVTLASQALQLARDAYQNAQAGLKASEDSVEFVRAASRALDMGKRELGQEDAIVRATLEALQHTSLITQESSTQLGVARSHEQPAQQHTSDTLRILQIKIALLMIMNQPDLDSPSGAMVASLQLAAAVADGGVAQISGAKLERLLTELDEIDGTRPRHWSKMDLQERVEVLQSVHDAVALVYRFESSTVKVVPLPPRENGNFSESTKMIQISKRLVMGNDHIQPLKTLMHESRHAYQWNLVKDVRRGFGWHSDTDWTLAQEWSDNFDDYKSPERYGTQEYMNQPIEVDARNFADTVIKYWFGK